MTDAVDNPYAGLEERFERLTARFSAEQIKEALDGYGENPDLLTKCIAIEAAYELPMSFGVFEGTYDLIGGNYQHIARLGQNSAAAFVADKEWAIVIHMPDEFSARAETARPIFEQIFRFVPQPLSSDHYDTKDIERWEQMDDLEYWGDDVDIMAGARRPYKDDKKAEAKTSRQIVYVGLPETAETRSFFDPNFAQHLRQGDTDAALSEYLSLGRPLIFKLYVAGEYVSEIDDSVFMTPLIKGSSEQDAKDALSGWIKDQTTQRYSGDIKSRVEPVEAFRPRYEVGADATDQLKL